MIPNLGILSEGLSVTNYYARDNLHIIIESLVNIATLLK
jgi:hypothetical protein